MTLSTKDISHIAQLARLDLTDQEIKQYRQDLSGIVNYVDQLQSVKIDKKMSKSIHQSTTWSRPDQVQTWDTEERLLALQQASAHEKKYIKVKRILG